MRFLLLTATIAVAIATLATPAGAKTQHETNALIHKQMVRYYHADGVIKSIGHVAYRTIYSSNPQKRHKWKRAVRWLTHVRDDAKAKIAALRTPPAPAYGGWDRIASCESGGNWAEVTGNGFLWGLQWLPGTWDSRARLFGFPTAGWFISHHSSPSRTMQIKAATGMSLSNWPVCGARW